jgi:hypothetical protein
MIIGSDGQNMGVDALKELIMQDCCDELGQKYRPTNNRLHRFPKRILVCNALRKEHIK